VFFVAKKNGTEAKAVADPSGNRTPPPAEFRCGRLRATVWKNHSDTNGDWYSVTLTRSYKDGEGQWKTATSLGRDDLLLAGEVLRMAYHWINRQYGGGLVQRRQPGAPDENPPAQDEGIPF
jgi:hypothetical protein